MNQGKEGNMMAPHHSPSPSLQRSCPVRPISGFGLIVIGSEILDGRIRDKHVDTTRRLLSKRHLCLHYVLVLPDDPDVIDAHLAWAESRPHPFFCCGGIGSTPDDYTRHCAARIAGVTTELHAEAAAILRERFGEDATPARLRMVEFPSGAELIPNPVNRVPGFSIGKGYYLPGFPSMAAPMMEWVLDTFYVAAGETVHRAMVLPGAREADLVDVMEEFIAGHPTVAFSSLPRFTEDGTEVVLGLTGKQGDVDAGVTDLCADLDRAGIGYSLVERSS